MVTLFSVLEDFVEVGGWFPVVFPENCGQRVEINEKHLFSKQSKIALESA